MQKYLLAAILLLSSVLPALAGDWSAAKLRGAVLAADIHGDGQWHRLARGDLVQDDRPIRTLASGNVTFVRGSETIAFGPNSEARIIDRRSGSFTTVLQQSGQVSVAADARKVQHFAVETPYLVVVVKGTVFTVATSSKGSQVSVSRGLVAVTDRRSRHTVMLPAGRQLVQSATGQTWLSGVADPVLTHPVINGVVEDAVGTAGGVGSGSIEGAAYLGGDNLGSVVGTTTGAVGSTVGGLGGGLGSTVSGVTGNVGNSLGGNVGGAVSGIGSVAGGAVSGAAGAVGQTVQSAGGAVGNTLNRLGL